MSKTIKKKAVKLLGLIKTNLYCPICGKKIKEKEFKDALSLREFHISGLCQLCQDKTFSK